MMKGNAGRELVMDIWRGGVDEVLSGLRSGAGGLGQAEAGRRLASFGENRVLAHPREALALRFARGFTHFFAIILWFAAALAMVAERFDPGQGMASLAGAIVGVIFVNGCFSFWQEYRAGRAIDALGALLPQRASVLRDGVPVSVLAQQLVPGDVVLLEAGDNVPADCRLLEAAGLRVNMATVTGESRPVSRVAAPVEAGTAIDARNLMLAGTAVVAGRGRAVVFATGMHTEFGHIAHLSQHTDERPSPLTVEIARLSRLVAIAATALGVAFFFVGRAIGVPFWDSALFAVGIIVANVPEGLLPTVTLSLAMATRRMARRNALIRHLPAVEALGATTVICTDKTGTLTANRMRVANVLAVGEARDATPSPGGRSGPPSAALAGLLAVAAGCHSLRPDTATPGGWVGDPTELALLEYATGHGVTETGTRLAELPFETGRNRMSVAVDMPGGARLLCKGAPEVVVPRCVGWRGADGGTLTHGCSSHPCGTRRAGAKGAAGHRTGKPQLGTGGNRERRRRRARLHPRRARLFLCRDPRRAAWPPGIAANPLLAWGIAFELVLIVAIVYHPVGNELFGTAPLAAVWWLRMLALAMAMVALEEGRKYWVRSSLARRHASGTGS